MERDVVLNRILRDMKMSGLISEESNGDVKIYLNAVYVAGLEAGKKSLGHGSKIIQQFDRSGNLINTFSSLKEAALKTKVTCNGIYKAISQERPTSKGYIWKYKTTSI
jgi:hypothetical protein